MTVEFEVPGTPLARKAHKIIRLPNGSPRPVLDPKCESFQNLIKLCGSQAMTGRNPIDRPVEVHITACWPAPKSMRKKERQQLEDMGYLPYPKRGDLDNVAKNILDGLKGIVIADDRLVTDLHLRKRIALRACTEITVTEL